MDNILRVTMNNGEEIEITVLDIIKTNFNNIDKEYIIYTIPGSEEVVVSILNENETSYSIDTIEDESEFKYVEKFLLELTKEDLE